MPTPIKSGAVLRERYKIRRIIGQGGMGCIYMADDLRLEGRLCALKEVEHDTSMPKDMLRQARDQFLREATVLARLDHPNLPKVSDFFSEGQRDYLVMDYVPGKDLRTLMKEARQDGSFLPEKEVLGWAAQLSDALAFMHEQQPSILHRDIKPSNLKLTPSGLIKLVDFGLVKILASEEMTITILQGRGTALYTPLEQYGGDTGHTDARSDIYAFGATLYHLLTNQPPVEARERFLHPDSLIAPKQLNPAISTHTERAILWAMSLHPDDRPPDVESFRQALVGNLHPITQPRRAAPSPRFANLFSSPPESILVAILAGVLLLSLLATLFR
ncbi:MAG TPA: serine/threonine-protein kinase [Anaerolineales bacterium]|nr:serine/threonine-protein kinase [Anaerolineales bacterium]